MIFEQEKIKEKFNKTIEALNEKIKQTAVLSASPALVEDIEIIRQGYKMKLKEVASIRLGDQRTLIIEPWDKNTLKDIMSAIFEAKINGTPVCEQNFIRLKLHPITTEDKERLIKKIKEIKEQTRIALRHQREDFLRSFDEAEKQKQISKDQKFKFKEALEKIVKEFNDKIEKIVDQKINSIYNA